MDKEDLVKLVDGRIVKIKSLPTSFMANGSYEVLHSEANVKFWVKPEDIMYIVDKEVLDDINNYFEVIWDEDGLNLIPKDFFSVDIESDREDFNRIKFNYDEGRKHRTINIHIGDKQINDKDKITIRPKKKKKSKIKKIINILKNKKENYE
jgi:hypothetical protein